eukprot:gene20709-biopygen13126
MCVVGRYGHIPPASGPSGASWGKLVPACPSLSLYGVIGEHRRKYSCAGTLFTPTRRGLGHSLGGVDGWSTDGRRMVDGWSMDGRRMADRWGGQEEQPKSDLPLHLWGTPLRTPH